MYICFMPSYYVNKNAQPTGEHEVHKEGCGQMPDPENRLPLGNFQHCSAAVTEAKKHYDNVDGCYYCSNECHTR